MESKNNKKKLKLNADAFYGRLDHKNIMQRILDEIQPINIKEYIGLPEDEDLKQKHILYAVVKHLIETAEQHNWNLCKAYDYTYIFNGAFWKQCSKDDMRKFLSDAAIKMGVPAYEAKHFQFAENQLKQFLSDAYIQKQETEQNTVSINLNNGTFEITEKGWQLRDFNPNEFITYQLPFDYDASATCPMFDDFLLKVVPDESSRMVLQEFAGFIFTNLNLEKCLVLLGTGGNGKSVFFNVINALVGKENVLNYSLGLFSHEYNRAKLTNVLLNYSSEKGLDLHPDIFKALVSAEPLQAREPYGKSFTLYNRAKFFINANELPRETESTDAYYRRFEIVPFERKITDAEKDISLADKIIANELPGVFNWLLVGLQRILQQKQFTVSKKGQEALAEFRKQSDSVELFIEEHNIVKSQTNKETLADLYKEYKSFCIDDGYKPLGKKRFSLRLETKGFERTRNNMGATSFFIEKQSKAF